MAAAREVDKFQLKLCLGKWSRRTRQPGGGVEISQRTRACVLEFGFVLLLMQWSRVDMNTTVWEARERKVVVRGARGLVVCLRRAPPPRERMKWKRMDLFFGNR